MLGVKFRMQIQEWDVFHRKSYLCHAVIPITWGRPVSVCANQVNGKEQFPLQCASTKTVPFLPLTIKAGSSLRITCAIITRPLTLVCIFVKVWCHFANWGPILRAFSHTFAKKRLKPMIKSNLLQQHFRNSAVRYNDTENVWLSCRYNHAMHAVYLSSRGNNNFHLIFSHQYCMEILLSE